MTSRPPSHAPSKQSSDKQVPAATPKLHVQRHPSKDSVTIHFSAQGKEEEEEDEEEPYGAGVSPDEPSIATAVEASEEMFEGVSPGPSAGTAPESSRLSSDVRRHTYTAHTQTLSAYLSEQKAPSFNLPPTKSLSFPSVDKPFLSLGKSLSPSDAESLPPSSSSSAAPTLRHRQLMKSLVKSLSSDTSQDAAASSSPSSSSPSTSHRLPESRLNLQLFKQFTHSRLPAAALSTSDCKTAPSSPQTSPENRSSFFKVSEVRFEGTRRRLTEVIAEPLQLLSKIIDEKAASGIYRPKVLSASAQELSCVDGPPETNNNDSIKEEEGGELEAGTPSASLPSSTLPRSANAAASPGFLSLGKCSMSALAKQEDEDFCILTSEDFDVVADTDAGAPDGPKTGSQSKVAPVGSTESCCSEDESKSSEAAPSVPYYTLLLLSVAVYGFLVVPLPSYVGGMLLGVGLGFLLAIGAVWLSGPKPSGGESTRPRRKLQDVAKLDIKEPDIYKGWMNEILNYDPETYHATLTHSVYVRLEGSIIRLSKPNHNIARRATHNEPKPDVTYISQKIYDLTNSRVYLAPPNLARKRTWNKKYPICIELDRQDDFMSKAVGEKSNASEGSGARERGEGGAGPAAPAISSGRELTLFLFGRTGREKEEWFQRFLYASKIKATKKALTPESRRSSHSSLEETLVSPLASKDSSTSNLAASSDTKNKLLLDYKVYMAFLMPPEAPVSPAAATPVPQSPPSSPRPDKKLQSITPAPEEPRGEEEDTVAWVNATLGRIFWDFLTEPHWAEVVSKKIQMKLSKIRLPYFMNELTISELDMGTATPRILSASKPTINYRGLWFNLDVSYSGSFLMTLETKMNLIRLGKEGESLQLGEYGKDGLRPRSYCLADSDEESSSAGSSDEENCSDVSNDSTGTEGLVGGHKPSKIMRFVDKIAKSKYFQKATETEFIKKKMEEVSNTRLVLTVELQELQGTLAVNIPPPPTDRIWYGFRTPPHLELKARPKLGERKVTLGHVTDWIERKLDQEFQKIFVMPNMDDIWLGVMHSALDPRSTAGPPVDPESPRAEPDSSSRP